MWFGIINGQNLLKCDRVMTINNSLWNANLSIKRLKKHSFPFFQAFLSRSYDPTELSMLIGDSSTEIPDDVIQAAMNLMEAHCDPNTGPTIGF